MRWFVTFLLALAVAVAAALLLFQDRIRTWRSPAVPVAATFDRLADLRDPTALRAITLTRDGQTPLTLTRNDNGTWSQPGNWPLRESEVALLANTLTALQPRFSPVPYTPETAEQFGFAPSQKPLTIIVDTKNDNITRTIKLTVGQPEAKANTTTFTQACTLRIDEEPEVVTIGPETYELLARSPEVYRRRQLISDVERIKFPADGGDRTGRTPLLGDAFTAVTLDNNGTKITFTRTAPTPEARRNPDRPNAEPTLTPERLAQAWEVRTEGATGIVDRPDPAKLKTLLTTVADLWAEGFVPVADATPVKTGLDKPTKSITLNRADGKTLTVAMGNVLRSSLKLEDVPPPAFPGAPPQPPKSISEEYRAAQIVGNELVFELRSDKLNDLFPMDVNDVRDKVLARWNTTDVETLTITLPGQPSTTLTRKAGNKDADKDDEKQDRWYVGDTLAEVTKVTELLDGLAKLETPTKDAYTDKPDAAARTAAGLDAAKATKISVTVKPKVAENDKPLPTRTVEYTIGNDDPMKKKLAVLVAGRDRVNLVDDAVFNFINRPALAYRSRKLIDTTGLTLAKLTVTKPDATFTLEPAAKVNATDETKWRLTAPITAPADIGKVLPFTELFTGLQAIEFVDEQATTEDLDKKYGLTMPKFTVTLGFKGSAATVQTFTLGNTREGKPEVYARLNGGNVFTIAKTVTDTLDSGAVGLLASQLWTIPDGKLKSITISREANPSYTISDNAGAWTLSGPFTATLPKATLDPTLALLRTVSVQKYETLTAKDLVPFGLDKPYLKATLTEEGTTRTLLIGKATADGLRFAKLEGDANPAIFTLPANIVQTLDVAPLDRLNKNLLTADATKVTTLKLSAIMPASALILTKDNETWKVQGQPFPVDSPTIQGLVFIASRPPTTRIAAYGDQTKWADYGLDNPTTITLEQSALPPEVPVTHVLKLGKAEANGERYFRVDDGLAVGVMPARAAEVLAKTKLDFVDRSLLKFDAANFLGLSRTAGKDTLELSSAGTGWEITKPTKLKADTAVIEDLAGVLSVLRADKVTAFAPKDLKEFGLDDAATTLMLTYTANGKPETKTLKLGKPVDAAKPDGDRYVSVDPQIVGVLNGATAKKCLASPLFYRDRTLTKFTDADIVELERGDRKVTFAKINGTWKQTKPIEAEAEQADLDDLVNALAVLRADELVAEKPKDLKPFGLDKPSAKWTLKASDKTVLTLLVGTKDKDTPRTHAMLEGGEMVALLDAALTQKVQGEYRKRGIWKSADAAQVENFVISTGSSNKVYRKGATGWIDTAKPNEPLPQGDITALLASFAGLKAERYAADSKPDLKLYGLEKPTRVIVVTQARGTTFTLKIGGPEGTSDGKKRYAQAEGSDTVFILSEADTTVLMK